MKLNGPPPVGAPMRPKHKSGDRRDRRRRRPPRGIPCAGGGGGFRLAARPAGHDRARAPRSSPLSGCEAASCSAPRPTFGSVAPASRSRSAPPTSSTSLGLLGRPAGIDFGPAVRLRLKRSDKDVGAPVGDVGFTVEAGGFVQAWLSPYLRLRAEARKGHWRPSRLGGRPQRRRGDPRRRPHDLLARAAAALRRRPLQPRLFRRDAGGVGTDRACRLRARRRSLFRRRRYQPASTSSTRNGA